MDIQTQTVEMKCNCSLYRAYTKLSDDVTSNIDRTNADLGSVVKKMFVFWHFFFLVMHGLLLCTEFMLYHSDVVKDICPPVTVCVPCAPCAPAPYECAPVVQCPKDNKHYDNCATLWAEAGY
jgi:hypothetical protein